MRKRNEDKIQAFCTLFSYNRWRKENLFTRRLRAEGLSDAHICAVIHAIETTCLKCFDRPSGCCCEKEE